MTLGTFAAAPAQAAIQRLVFDMAASATSPIKRRLKAWTTEDRMRRLYEHIRDIRKVKTIWQLDKPVDLKNFYHPTTIIFGAEDDDQRVVDSTIDLPADENIVFEGTAGQGKSMFFRYLTSREMYRGESIPIFLELRRLAAGEPLVSFVIEIFSQLRLPCDPETFLFLANRGSVKLFLDGFDELERKERVRVLREVEHLAIRYRKLRIYLSARPGTELATSTLLTRYELRPIRREEIAQVVNRLANAPDEADRICEQLALDDGAIADLLTTPLLIALLMFRFRADQILPDNLEAFFNVLFEVLLTRHDKLKPGGGYVRPRSCGLSDQKIQRLFDALCFTTRKDSASVIKRAPLLKYAAKASDRSGIACDPEDFVNDIVRITCMLLQEGDEYRFIHKSVQEYHAACYISNLDDERAIKFYIAMQERWMQWRQELEFLRVKDTYRFFRWFGLPEIRRTLGIERRAPLPAEFAPNPASVEAICRDGTVQRNRDTGEVVAIASCEGYFLPARPIVRGLNMKWETVVAGVAAPVREIKNAVSLQEALRSALGRQIVAEICDDRMREYFSAMLKVGQMAQTMVAKHEAVAREDDRWML